MDKKASFGLLFALDPLSGRYINKNRIAKNCTASDLLQILKKWAKNSTDLSVHVFMSIGHKILCGNCFGFFL